MAFQMQRLLGDASEYIDDAAASSDATDLNTIRQWSIAVKQAGFVPTRMPRQYVGAGELCYRGTGPGTVNPNMKAPFVYVLAPQNVRVADGSIYYRLREQVDALAPPGGPGMFDDLTALLKNVAIVGGVGLAAYALISFRRK